MEIFHPHVTDEQKKVTNVERSNGTTFYDDNGDAAIAFSKHLKEGYFSVHQYPSYLDQEFMDKGARFLKKETITVIPTYQEEQTVGGVVDHLIRIQKGEQNNLLVVIAPPKNGLYDTSAERAEEAGARHIVFQDEILHHAIDWDKLEKKTGVTPDHRGKGMTTTAGEILIAYAPLPNMPKMETGKVEKVNHHDSDVYNPDEFAVLSQLVMVAMEHSQKYLEIRAARGGRNNEPIHEAIKALPVWGRRYGEAMFKQKRGNKRGIISRDYPDHMYNALSKLKWPLSGQVMEDPSIVMNTLRPTGYGIEVGMNISAADIEKDPALNPENKSVAQVEIGTPCIDGGNDARKEQIVESMINRLMAEMISMAIEKGKPTTEFTLQDLKELNLRLKEHKVEYYIPPGDGPNQAQAIKQDAIMPSLNQMEKAGILRVSDLRTWVDKKYGKRYKAVDKDSVMYVNGNTKAGSMHVA